MTQNQFYDVVLELRKEGKTWEECARFLLKSRAVSNKTTGKDVQLRFQEMAARIASGEINLDESESEFEKAVQMMDEYIGRVRTTPKKSPNKTQKNFNKILLISDLHIPYCDYEKLWRAIDDGVNQGCNICVINGDYLNGDRLSTHAKFKHESFKEEVAQGAAVLERIADKFDTVYLLDDNHVHDRWRRLLGNHIPADLHFLLIHPYDFMVSGIPNVIRSSQTHEQFPDELGHFLILGDIMFSHGFVSGKDGESVRKVQQWYRNWKSTLNLPDVRVTAQGHTHELSLIYGPDSAIIQTGTFASLDGLRYSLEGNLKYTAPCYGYVILEQFDGKTDLSTIRVIKQ